VVAIENKLFTNCAAVSPLQCAADICNDLTFRIWPSRRRRRVQKVNTRGRTQTRSHSLVGSWTTTMLVPMNSVK